MCAGAPLLKCESLFNPSWFSCNVDCTLGMITGVIAEHLMHQPVRPRCNLTNVLGQSVFFFWGKLMQRCSARLAQVHAGVVDSCVLCVASVFELPGTWYFVSFYGLHDDT